VEVPDPLLAILRGEVDIATGGGERELDDGARRSLQDPRYAKITDPGEWARALHLNLSKGFPYDDVRFRRAVVHAIDRDRLVQRVLGGRGTIGSIGGMARRIRTSRLISPRSTVGLSPRRRNLGNPDRRT
jgi:ABC-type transport system substrate-binding protein